MRNRDKERAKAIIVEIIRQAGGRFRNKTNLFKAFWRAHVAYAESHLTPLSDWPIVRMPMGPGIDRFDALLGELLLDGAVEVEQVQHGDFVGFVFHLLPGAPESLTPDEIEAVKIGVAAVDGKPANQVSDDSHDHSRSWQLAKDGEELDVFLDVIPEEEYREREQRLYDMLSVLEPA
ncbi:MAG: hypothetical protein AB7U20_15500 [Planctomycetaceae bacterium]